MVRAAALAAFALLSGCAPTTAPVAPPGARRVLLEVPHSRERAQRGGVAALSSVLAYWGRAAAPGELREELDRDSFQGALTGDVVKAAQRRGFSAEVLDATLAQVKRHLDEGRPLIAVVEEGVWRRRGRYLVLIGYDEDRRGVYAHGRRAYRFYPYETFFRHWASTRRAALLLRPVDGSERAEAPAPPERTSVFGL